MEQTLLAINTAILTYVFLLFAHFIADFIFQTNWMAQNKNHDFYALLTHVLVYTLVFGIFSFVVLLPLISLEIVIIFICLNGVLHLITDYFTSKVSSYFWKTKELHNFFVTIGCDQFIHNSCIAGSLLWLVYK